MTNLKILAPAKRPSAINCGSKASHSSLRIKAIDGSAAISEVCCIYAATRSTKTKV